MKITGDCPHCKKEVAIDIDKLEVKQPKPVEIPNASVTGQQTQQIQKEPELKEVKKIVIEDFKPNYECPDGNCDVGVHKNKNFKKRPKGKCTNCDQFAKHESGTCPWCKKDEIEPIDPEELDDLGIPKPTEIENESHDHE